MGRKSQQPSAGSPPAAASSNGAVLSGPDGRGLSTVLATAGFNAIGVLAAGRYDALVAEPWRTRAMLPGAQSVVVLATGGRAFHDAFRAAPEAALRQDPIDRFTRRVVEQAALQERSSGHAARAGFYFERRGAGNGVFADFVSLAEASGLGRPGRLGILLHPEYGPWLAIRALLLLARPLAESLAHTTAETLAESGPGADFDACVGCRAPCVEACPGSAIAPEPSEITAAFDFAICRETSDRLPACAVGCAARRACVYGVGHTYDAEAEALHRSAALRVPLRTS